MSVYTSHINSLMRVKVSERLDGEQRIIHTFCTIDYPGQPGLGTCVQSAKHENVAFSGNAARRKCFSRSSCTISLVDWERALTRSTAVLTFAGSKPQRMYANIVVDLRND